MQTPYLLSPSTRQCLTISHLTITSFISSFIIKSWYRADLKGVCTLDDSTESKVKEPWQVRVGSFALFLQISEVSRRSLRECKGSEQRCDWKPGSLVISSSCLIHKFPNSSHQALWSKRSRLGLCPPLRWWIVSAYSGAPVTCSKTEN